MALKVYDIAFIRCAPEELMTSNNNTATAGTDLFEFLNGVISSLVGFAIYHCASVSLYAEL